ncbi:SH3 domain-containing protein [Leptospira venezuelensis]|uniref:SH3 domain-containing protein n=1 Tax=Leptospira venezuelensis TaxID=1958811 RepID=UPI000A3D274A|nr:SH3 domain-containing protein [Leptospira venezuelensis]
MKSFLTILCLICISFSYTHSEPCKKFQEYTIIPTDESSKNKSFSEFKKELDKALGSKDFKFLNKIVDPEIKFSFGADSGKKGFWKEWGLDKNPEKSEIWATLQNTLRLGIVQSDPEQFTSPTIYSKFPEKLDAFEYSWISGKNVNIRESADINSKVLDNLSYQIVKLDPEDAIESKSCAWKKICLSSGKSGYVCDTYLRSSVDYRAFFSFKKDRWKLTIFVAGD